jgi:hypothetical protein
MPWAVTACLACLACLAAGYLLRRRPGDLSALAAYTARARSFGPGPLPSGPGEDFEAQRAALDRTGVSQ